METAGRGRAQNRIVRFGTKPQRARSARYGLMKKVRAWLYRVTKIKKQGMSLLFCIFVAGSGTRKAEQVPSQKARLRAGVAKNQVRRDLNYL